MSILAIAHSERSSGVAGVGNVLKEIFFPGFAVYVMKMARLRIAISSGVPVFRIWSA